MMELKETLCIIETWREKRGEEIGCQRYIHSYLSHIYVHTLQIYLCENILIVYERYITFNTYIYKHVNRDKINVFPSAFVKGKITD